MRENLYTQTVSKIKAPEGAVEKMLETAESFDKKEKVMHINNWIKGAVAASIVIAITLGAIIGFNPFGGSTTGHSFVMTVNAEEITKDHPVSVVSDDCDRASTFYFDGSNWIHELDFSMPLLVKGEHIKSVNYSIEDGIFVVSYNKGDNPVVEGDVIPSANEQERFSYKFSYNPDGYSESTAYSNITLAYDNQKPDGDGCIIEIRKKGLRDSITSEFLKTIVYCTVTFDDGTEQTLSIMIDHPNIDWESTLSDMEAGSYSYITAIDHPNIVGESTPDEPNKSTGKVLTYSIVDK